MDKRHLTHKDITLSGLYLDEDDDVWIKRDDKKLRLLTVYGGIAKKNDRFAVAAEDYTFTELHLFDDSPAF